jgi:hypothetical protein
MGVLFLIWNRLYGVSYTMNVVGLSEANASIGFGGVALFAGFFGTAFGGVLLDKYRKKSNSLYNIKKSLNLAVRVMLFCGGIVRVQLFINSLTTILLGRAYGIFHFQHLWSAPFLYLHRIS